MQLPTSSDMVLLKANNPPFGQNIMPIQQLLGIELPLIQAPMAGVQGSALAIAVSNAGGLGSLPCAMLGIDAIRQEVGEIRRHTQKPFNANFFCHTPPVTDMERDRAWLALFAGFYAELGVDIADTPPVAA